MSPWNVDKSYFGIATAHTSGNKNPKIITEKWDWSRVCHQTGHWRPSKKYPWQPIPIYLLISEGWSNLLRLRLTNNLKNFRFFESAKIEKPYPKAKKRFNTTNLGSKSLLPPRMRRDFRSPIKYWLYRDGKSGRRLQHRIEIKSFIWCR